MKPLLDLNDKYTILTNENTDIFTLASSLTKQKRIEKNKKKEKTKTETWLRKMRKYLQALMH